MEQDCQEQAKEIEPLATQLYVMSETKRKHHENEKSAAEAAEAYKQKLDVMGKQREKLVRMIQILEWKLRASAETEKKAGGLATVAKTELESAQWQLKSSQKSTTEMGTAPTLCHKLLGGSM